MIDNLYPESIETSGSYFRMALQHIARHQLPYNPITYAVWYEYTSSRNERLIRELDELEKSGITYETIVALFRKHIADQQLLMAEQKTLELKAILKEMTRHLSQTGNRMDNRGNMLEDYAQKLGSTASLEEITAIAKEIIAETKSMAKDSQDLKQEVDDTVSEIDILKKELEGIKQAAKTDMLTGLLNRRGFDEAISTALEHSAGQGTPLSIIMTDIDHFKLVNDTYGHLIGDNVLKMLSKLLKEHIKGKDIVARFGGEEFIMVLPETALEGAYVLAEQIRMSLRTMRWRTKDSGKSIGAITVSMGVSQHRPAESVTDMIERADRALYQAKTGGRNRTCTELDIDAASSAS